MPTAEDNYRVEVWDDDEMTLIETLSRSPDHMVSVAAWHAAVRVRPGRLLLHRNSTFTMTRIIAPGVAGEDDSKPRALRLSDLRGWHRLRAWCYGCSNHADLDVKRLRARLGDGATFGAIESRLKCHWYGKGPVEVQIFSISRGEGGAASEVPSCRP